MSSQRLLTFQIQQQYYALDILKVQELRSYEKPTHMVNSAPHVLGVINLRGNMVGVMDLRILWSKDISYNDSTITMVLQVTDKHTIGVVVDGVADVVEIDSENIHDMPLGDSTAPQKGLKGIINVEGRTILLVDPAEMLAIV